MIEVVEVVGHEVVLVNVLGIETAEDTADVLGVFDRVHGHAVQGTRVGGLGVVRLGLLIGGQAGEHVLLGGSVALAAEHDEVALVKVGGGGGGGVDDGAQLRRHGLDRFEIAVGGGGAVLHVGFHERVGAGGGVVVGDQGDDLLLGALRLKLGKHIALRAQDVLLVLLGDLGGRAIAQLLARVGSSLVAGGGDGVHGVHERAVGAHIVGDADRLVALDAVGRTGGSTVLGRGVVDVLLVADDHVRQQVPYLCRPGIVTRGVICGQRGVRAADKVGDGDFLGSTGVVVEQVVHVRVRVLVVLGGTEQVVLRGGPVQVAVRHIAGVKPGAGLLDAGDAEDFGSRHGGTAGSAGDVVVSAHRIGECGGSHDAHGQTGCQNHGSGLGLETKHLLVHEIPFFKRTSFSFSRDALGCRAPNTVCIIGDYGTRGSSVERLVKRVDVGSARRKIDGAVRCMEGAVRPRHQEVALRRSG